MPRALVVIDVQGAMVAAREAGYPWANTGAEAKIAALIAGFRDSGLPVIHVHHIETEPGAEMAPGSAGAAALDCALPGPDEAVFVKHGSSAFIGTGLEDYLRSRGLKDLVMIGGEANLCVESSTRMAGNLGFAPTVVEDALINFQRTLRDGRVMRAPDVLAMTLANLDGCFATIANTSEVLRSLQS